MANDRGDEAARKALDAVAEAVRITHEQTGEAATLESKPNADVVDFGNLSAEPLLKFCEAASVHIEQVGQEVANEGHKLNESCIKLAGDIRQVAREQADAIRAQAARTRKAAEAISKIRDEFRADVARELEAVEATRKTVTPESEAKTG